MQSESTFELGTESYREGALLRLREAWVLYYQEEWVGCIYLAGRAAESILRSLIWARTRKREVGHDLRDLLKRVRMIVTFGETNEARLDDAVNELAIVWRNDLRYTGQSRFRRMLDASRRLRRIRGVPVKGDPLKANAKSVLEAAEGIVARGEPYARKTAGQAGSSDRTAPKTR